jgi:hypothetical protein
MPGFSAHGQFARGQIGVIYSNSVVATISGIWAKLLTIEALINSKPSATQIIDEDGLRIIDGSITRNEMERIILSELIGNATLPSGDGIYTFMAQDGTTIRIRGTILSNSRTIQILNGTP